MSGEPTLEQNVDLLIKRLLLKDLRTQCRQRKLSPAGGREQLADRLKEDMLAKNDFTLRGEDGQPMDEALVSQMFGGVVQCAKKGNNFTRPEGQNVGNFLGDRPSSRVLAAPGGASNFSFAHGPEQPAPRPPAPQPMPAMPEEPPAAPVTGAKLSFLDKMTAKIAGSPAKAPSSEVATFPPASENIMVPAPVAVSVPEPVVAAEPSAPAATGIKDNNYSRPSGQNVGNFITDKPSSRVLAPPGGGSALRLG